MPLTFCWITDCLMSLFSDLFGKSFFVGQFIKSLLFVLFIGRRRGVVILAHTPHPLITLK